MKHVLFGQKALFLGDEAADALVAYAGHVAQTRSGDSVAMRGVNAEGNLVVTTFVLNSGTQLVSESTTFAMDEPDNDMAIAYIRGRIEISALNPDFSEGFRLSDD